MTGSPDLGSAPADDDRPPILEPGAGFVVATGIECSAPKIAGGQRIDELEATDHYRRYADDIAAVRRLGVRYLRYGIPFHRVNPAPSAFDWDFTDRALSACRQRGIEPIADLLHFGLPDDLAGFGDERLPERFAAFVRGFAARYPWLRYYTPVNEPLITAWFSARVGWWNERKADEPSFVRALLNVARCALLGAEEIRSVRPDAILIAAETCHYVHPTRREEAERAQLENELRFASFELVFGRTLPGVLADHLLANGADRDELRWFEGRGTDRGWIVGNDYYATSELLVTDDGSMRPAGVRLGYYELARQYHERLGLPIMHTETNANGRRAVAWLHQQWRDVQRLLDDGIPIRGFTWYGFVNHVDWDTALREANGRENACGLVALDRSPNPVYEAFRKIVLLNETRT